MSSLKKIDRLTIVVTGEYVDQLLGISRTTKRAGGGMCEAIYDNLEKWKAADHVKAILQTQRRANLANIFLILPVGLHL